MSTSKNNYKDKIQTKKNLQEIWFSPQFLKCQRYIVLRIGRNPQKHLGISGKSL